MVFFLAFESHFTKCRFCEIGVDQFIDHTPAGVGQVDVHGLETLMPSWILQKKVITRGFMIGVAKQKNQTVNLTFVLLAII